MRFLELFYKMSARNNPIISKFRHFHFRQITYVYAYNWIFLACLTKLKVHICIVSVVSV